MRVLSRTPWRVSWRRTQTCWSAISPRWCSSPSTRSSRPSSRRATWSGACGADPPPLPLSSKSPLVLLSIIWPQSRPTSSGVSSPTRTACQGAIHTTSLNYITDLFFQGVRYDSCSASNPIPWVRSLQNLIFLRNLANCSWKEWMSMCPPWLQFLQSFSLQGDISPISGW